MSARLRPWLVPTLTFLAGLLIGWLLLGWVVAPPPPKNATPAALVDNYRKDYLALVADSYAQNGNANVVRQRLQGFDLSQVVTDLDSLARQSEALSLAGQAARLRSLAVAINRGDVGPLSRQPQATSAAGGTASPTGVGAPTVSAAAKAAGAAAAANAAEASSRVPSDWIIIGAFGLLAAALAVWAWQRWHLRRAADAVVPISGAATTRPAPPPSASPALSVAATAGGGPVYVTLNQPARIAFHSDSPDNADLRIFDTAVAGQTKTVIGQVDLRVAEILRPDPTQLPAALELRLFDRRAARTMVAILVSAEAYKDPTARQLISTLANNVVKPAVDVSRTGRTVELETRYLRLQAEVVSVQFLSATPYPTFDELVLEVTPMPNDEPSDIIDADYTLASPDGGEDDPAVDEDHGGEADNPPAAGAAPPSP